MAKDIYDEEIRKGDVLVDAYNHWVCVYNDENEDMVDTSDYHILCNMEFIESFNDGDLPHCLVANRIRTPDGTMLWSKYTHEFHSHKDANGEMYILDGGTSYIRTSVNSVPAEDLSVYADDEDFEKVREVTLWGSGGKWIPVKDITDAHLRNIICYLISNDWIGDYCKEHGTYRVLFREFFNRKLYATDNKEIETLEDTVKLMTSYDYRNRFRAEYHQLRIRLKKLESMLKRWDEGNLDFKPTCERNLYDIQINAMQTYLDVLKMRAHDECIEL